MVITAIPIEIESEDSNVSSSDIPYKNCENSTYYTD